MVSKVPSHHDSIDTSEYGDDAAASLRSPQSKRLALLALAALSAVYLASIFFAPSGGPANENYFTICGFKNFIGLPCPGCGLTHSFCALGKGDLWTAFGYNLLGPPLFLFLLMIWLRSAFVLLGFSSAALAFDKLTARVKPVRAFVIAFAVFGVARILYLLAYKPLLADNSPLLKLLVWITG